MPECRRAFVPYGAPQFRKAFTFTELTVVMVILVVLIGIFLAVLPYVHARMYATTCEAQLHSLGIAFASYMSDNRQHYPPAATTAVPNEHLPQSPSLLPFLGPYLGYEVRIFRCPLDESAYKAVGSSYFYLEMLGQNQPLVFLAFGSSSYVPVLSEASYPDSYAVFHHRPDRWNILYADGHVDSVPSAHPPK